MPQFMLLRRCSCCNVAHLCKFHSCTSHVRLMCLWTRNRSGNWNWRLLAPPTAVNQRLWPGFYIRLTANAQFFLCWGRAISIACVGSSGNLQICAVAFTIFLCFVQHSCLTVYIWNEDVKRFADSCFMNSIAISFIHSFDRSGNCYWINLAL